MTLPGGGFKAGDAYIEFHATADGVPKDLEAALRRNKTATDRYAGKAGEDVGAEMARGIGRELGSNRSSSALSRALDTLFKRGRKKIKEEDIIDVGSGLSFERTADNLVSRFFSSFTRLFKRRATATSGAGSGGLGGVISTMFTNLVQNVGGGITSIGSSVGNVGAAGPLAPVAGIAVALGIPAIIGAISALMNVLLPLVNVIFLLPGAIAVLVGAIVPLVFVFHGLAGAIAAVASGDPEQITKAFEGMAPAAQEVAKQIAGLLPWFRELRKAFQQAFFEPLVADNTIDRLRQAIAGPISRGMEHVAAAAGGFAANLVLVAESPTVQKFLTDLFNVSANLFQNTSAGFNQFLIGLAALSDKSLPFIDILINKLGAFLDRFGNWLQGISQADFNAMMDKLKGAFDSLMTLFSSGWNLLKALFGDDPGNIDRAKEFFNQLVATLDDMTAFFKSEVGQQSLRGMITLAEAALEIIKLIAEGWATVGFAVESVRQFVDFLGQSIVHLLELVGILGGNTTKSVAPAVKDIAQQFVNRAAETFKENHRPFATGGILYSPEVVSVAEKGPEAIIPLNDPARAMQLATQSGLASLISGQGSGQSIRVQVFIGQQELSEIVDSRVSRMLNRVGQQLSYGARSS